ncbi:MAG: hypothetical protein GC185_01850 [Alphaproteobacteria bacterium]|nr:hypothetical protein [Alphaproteobacteria bacterium]
MKPINSKALDDLQVGFTSLYNGAAAQVTPQWDKVAMEVQSTGAEEKYGWLGEIPEMREWLGDRVIHALSTHDYNIKNKDFESTIGVPRNAIADDKLGVYAPMVQMMGDGAARHPDKLTFSLLKNGFATECYDGQYFFDTDHPVIDEDGVTINSVSNSGGGSGNAWFLLDTSRPVKPLIFQTRQAADFVLLNKPDDANVFMQKRFLFGVDGRWNAGYALWQLAYGSKQTLDATSYAAAVANLESRKGDHGKPLGLQATMLVVGPSNKTAAKTLLTAERDQYGATNIHRDTAELVVSPYLD